MKWFFRMRVAALVSGGKDSLLALHKASEEHEAVCLITAFSTNFDSYMFHTDAVELVRLQADSMDLPLITFKTKGIKEEELVDLEKALVRAKDEFRIQGVVSGAIASNYQKKRIDNLCQGLGLESLAPLWGQDSLGLLGEVVRDFKVIIVKVAAEGLDDSWLGRELDESFVKNLPPLIHPMGEGGEYESLVLNAPLFTRELVIEESFNDWDGVVGHLIIKKAVLGD